MNAQGNTYLTLGDFSALVFTFFGVIALVSFIILVIKLIHVVSKLSKIIDDSSEHIAKTAKALPDTIENVNSLVDHVNQTVEQVGPGVSEISDALGEAAATVKNINSGMSGMGNSAGTILGVIIPLWEWLSNKFKKENKDFDKNSGEYEQKD